MKLEKTDLKNFNIKLDFETSKISWLKSGGIASYYCKIKNDSDLLNIFKILNKNNIRHLIIGNFSNLLIKSSGYDGILIKLSNDYSKIKLIDDRIIAGSSVIDSTFARFCYEKSITGFEYLFTIPGTIGGNLFMNAGCYGNEFKDKILSVNIFDTKKLLFLNIKSNEINFDYRKGLQNKNYVILSVEMKAKFENKDYIKLKMKEFDNLRKLSQPQKVNCCGSIFKNPKNLSAWQLIKSSVNQKFYTGQIKLSKKHCNFFENEPNINPDALENFLNQIEEKVYDKHNIRLEKELKIIGNDDY